MKKTIALFVVCIFALSLISCSASEESARSDAVEPEIAAEDAAPVAVTVEAEAVDETNDTEDTAVAFTADAEEYRGGIAECDVCYFDSMGQLYAIESIVYSAPNEVYSDSFTDADGKAQSAVEPGLYPPQLEENGDYETQENGDEKTVTLRGKNGMKSDIIKYDEAGNPLKWTYFDKDGNISGWLTYTYRFADGSQATGGNM